MPQTRQSARNLLQATAVQTAPVRKSGRRPRKRLRETSSPLHNPAVMSQSPLTMEPSRKLLPLEWEPPAWEPPQAPWNEKEPESAEHPSPDTETLNSPQPEVSTVSHVDGAKERRKEQPLRMAIVQVLDVDGQDRIEVIPWTRLDGIIYGFASQLEVQMKESGRDKWECLDEGTQKEFLSWALDARNIFSAFEGFPILFASWIWRILAKSVFNFQSPDIEWKSPYFKAQNEMRKWLLENDPKISTDSQSLFFWHHWNYVAGRMHVQTTVDNFHSSLFRPSRIDPASIAKIICNSLGSNLPTKMSFTTQKCLNSLCETVVEVDGYFNNTLTDFELIFHHPETKQTSGFLLEPEVSGFTGHAMHDVHLEFLCPSKERGNIKLERIGPRVGYTVDFVASPLVLMRTFTGLYKDKRIFAPMSVYMDSRKGALDEERELSEELDPLEDGRTIPNIEDFLTLDKHTPMEAVLGRVKEDEEPYWFKYLREEEESKKLE